MSTTHVVNDRNWDFFYTGVGCKIDCDLPRPHQKIMRQANDLAESEKGATMWSKACLLELLDGTFVNTAALVDQVTYIPNV